MPTIETDPHICRLQSQLSQAQSKVAELQEKLYQAQTAYRRGCMHEWHQVQDTYWNLECSKCKSRMHEDGSKQ